MQQRNIQSLCRKKLLSISCFVHSFLMQCHHHLFDQNFKIFCKHLIRQYLQQGLCEEEKQIHFFATENFLYTVGRLKLKKSFYLVWKKIKAVKFKMHVLVFWIFPLSGFPHSKDRRVEISEYTEILVGKVVLWCFFSGKTSEKIHNYTFHIKISV